MALTGRANDDFNAVILDGVAMISSSTVKIPDYAFEDFVNIKEVVFESPSNCREIGEYAFLRCTSLKRIELPYTLHTIGTGAFYGCVSLEEVILPAHLRDIKGFAFIYCESLRNLELPQGLQHIGSNAFSRCVSLQEIEVPGSVTELESYAFSDCLSLERAALPGNPNMLGELIFSGCKSLLYIRESSPLPPAFDCKSYLFEPTDTEAYETCTLQVPRGKIGAYREAHGWNLFNNIEDEGNKNQ